jgi:hypothetical protein
MQEKQRIPPSPIQKSASHWRSNSVCYVVSLQNEKSSEIGGSERRTVYEAGLGRCLPGPKGKQEQNVGYDVERGNHRRTIAEDILDPRAEEQDPKELQDQRHSDPLVHLNAYSLQEELACATYSDGKSNQPGDKTYCLDLPEE